MAEGKCKSCWEHWDCSEDCKENCPAYMLDIGRACWIFTTKMQPRIKRDFNSCLECPWFKSSDVL